MTPTQLKQIMPIARQAQCELFAPILTEAMPRYSITGKLREAAFIAQLAHESGSLRYTRELASGNAYEGRKDLGNLYRGDGKKFLGRGLIQLTGRYNYEKLSKAFGQDFTKYPELLATPLWAVESACWFWHSKGLNELADRKLFTTITKRVNGGLNGAAERNEFYKRALAVL